MANVTSPKRRKGSSTAATSRSSSRKTYTVQDGDNIDVAAKALGITRQQVIARNGLRHELVFAGQVLHA